MNQLILKGKHRLTNLSIEERRDRVEEASWSCFGIPGNILTLNDLAVNIRSEYEKRDIHLTDNDIFRKQIGQPTHPITKALLDAEYPYMVTDAIKNEYGKMGWREALVSPRNYHYYSLEESQVPVMPTTRKPLSKLSNDELIDKLFCPFKRFTKYGNKLENHFRQKTGENLYFHLKEWADGKNTKKVHYLPKTTLEIRLSFTLKDWFGVDEEDVYKNESSTQMGRESLAAFWVLQHQRGYRPFINIITYEEEITVVF
ncbi:MAG: hypothetical protein LBT25_01275 [Candidatus Symbiothrix sp.]|jgi:hypothetical protein|nr:hypothetical protein [Candidatus Symbiothrix sp.]